MPKHTNQKGIENVTIVNERYQQFSEDGHQT